MLEFLTNPYTLTGVTLIMFAIAGLWYRTGVIGTALPGLSRWCFHYAYTDTTLREHPCTLEVYPAVFSPNTVIFRLVDMSDDAGLPALVFMSRKEANTLAQLLADLPPDDRFGK